MRGKIINSSNIRTILVISAIIMFIYFTNDDGGLKRDENGSIISAGNIINNDLRVGDCFNDLNPEEIQEFLEDNDSAESMDVDYVNAVPCSSAHNNEVFAISETLLEKFDSYPSEEDLSDNVYDFCAPMGFDYLGVSDRNIPDELKGITLGDLTLKETYDFQKTLMVQEAFPQFYVYFFPRINSWRLGDNSVSCILYTEIPRQTSVKNFFLDK